MKVIIILLYVRGLIAGNIQPIHPDIKKNISPKILIYNQEHLDALPKEIKFLQEKDDHAVTNKLTDTYRSRNIIRDADHHQTYFQENGNYRAEADYSKDPVKENNNCGDWVKCLSEELFGILCEHEVPHMLNDG